jgi:hypothetical protein
MPAEDFLHVIDSEITPHVNPREVLVIISGGEPLMRNDLADIGAALKARGYPWGMVTNGLALTKERIDELVSAGLRSITVSLDGLEKDHVWLRQHPPDIEGATRAIKLIVDYNNSFVHRTSFLRISLGFAPHTVDTSVRVAVVDPDAPLMLADSRSPNEITYYLVALFIARQTVPDGGINDLPVYQIFGCQNLQSRHVVERRGGHQIRIPYAAHIRVGVVVRKNRVRVTRYGSVNR